MIVNYNYVEKKMNEFSLQLITTIISSFFALSIFLISQIEISILKVILIISILFIYLIYLVKQNLYIMIYNIFYSTLFIYFIITLAKRKFIGYDAINYLYVIDLLLIILFFRVVFTTKYLFKIIRDKFFLIYFLLISLFSIYGLIRGSGFQNFIMVTWLYIRALPIYIVLRYEYKNIKKKDINWFLWLNIIVMPILIWKFPQDDIAGLYGYCGNVAFSLVMILILGYSIAKYLKAEISTKKFLIYILFYFLWTAIGENKFQLVFGGAMAIFLFFIVKLPNKYKGKALIYRILILISLPILTIGSIYLLMKIYPEWRYIFDIGIIEFWNSYTQKANVSFYQLGRLQVFDYLNTNVFRNFTDELFGLGIGNGMPSVMTAYNVFDYLMNVGESNYIELFKTMFYEKNSWSLGYHNSGIGIIYVECGILGLISYILTIVIMFKRALYLCLNKKKYILGYVGIVLYIYWIAIFIFYSPIIDVRFTFIYFGFSAVLSGYYYEYIKSKKLVSK